MKSKLGNCNAVVVFAKAPVAGKVKTRLAKRCNSLAAKNIYQRLLQKSIAAALDYDANVYISTPSQLNHPSLWRYKQQGIGILRQRRGNLGQKMAHCFKQLLAHHSRVAIIGTDAPAITATHIEGAFSDLTSADFSFCPAVDGGYVLVAAKANFSPAFQRIEWSSPRVMKQTVARLNSQGLSFSTGETLLDIDTLQDYKFARRQKMMAGW